ncbi:hypothetical protein MMO38_09550 [Acinetobacter sp. NIPH 1852]|uniref:hypothetical protein n=1 Tax=Acinetobacter sp. NIPH 1852 TaxID=2923428 RepID=UPI001F4A9B57|nr:hypothetical protein [Acinetobacter sp. NIPH 1852]MCH7308380.1 hypothetical protein [Acinetobacter sp. NIPH 1852]
MEIKEVRIHHIPAQNGVDPIDVFIAWYGEHKSQITIRCWDCAWTGYRGSHWTEKVEKYLVNCVDEGMTDHLVQLFSRTRSAKEIKWLTKIIGNIHQYFKCLESEATPNGD